MMARTKAAQVIRLELPAAYEYLPLVADSIALLLRQCEEVANPESQIYALQLIAHEACSLIISRAYTPGESGRLWILLSVTQYPLAPSIRIEIRDTGRWLNLDPEHNAPVEQLPDGSNVLATRLFLLLKLTHRFSYKAVGNTNRMCLIKLLA